VLARGILLDRDTGAPIERGVVRLVAHAEGEWAWERTLTTAADGRFELRGPPNMSELALSAFAHGYEAGAAEAVGRDVVLRLQRESATLVVEVRLDPGIPRSWLELVLVDPSGAVIQGALREESMVFFEGLTAYEHALEVRTTNGAWTVERQQRVHPVTERQLAALDARLAPLDLTGRFDLAPLVLRGLDGAPLADTAVAARIEPWGSGRRRLRTDGAGRLTLLVPRGCREIELAPEGWRPLVLGWLPGEQVLTFSRH
jgi:hypothetical protein